MIGRLWVAFVWWGWRGSPLRLRAACAPRGAAYQRRSPAAKNADTAAFSSRGFEPHIFNAKTKSPSDDGLFVFGGDGGALRFACGLLALRTAQPPGGAPRGGKPSSGRFADRPSSPFERKPNKKPPSWVAFVWWGWRGSNPRPLRCERSALTSWATSPRKGYFTVSGWKWQDLFRCILYFSGDYI